MPTKRPSKTQQQTDRKLVKANRDNRKNATETSKKSTKSEKGSKDESSSTTSGNSKMTLCTYPTTVGIRPQIRERRPGRPPSGKRLSMVSREMPAKVRSALRRSLDPCDNSNDSGLGFDHHSDPQHMGMSDRVTWNHSDRAEIKRPRLDIKLEQDERLIRTLPSTTIPPTLNVANNQGTSTGRSVPMCLPLSTRQSSSTPISLTTQLTHVSRYMDISLTILKQPEQQHRARYQTEGSRGAVKDREGNGFPVVQLTGYYQPTTLQVFIGTDVGKVVPHMFYQACKVSGKNSTPCIEKKLDGTCVIELQLDPSKEMSATCDCVGILKERNVDVEHRFPDQLASRSKKKSTRCRMIFRTTITHDDGTTETLQVCSQPIVCTQPPGVPEICKKSLSSCPASGGLELFVLGKNFLKDTKVYFQQIDDDRHIRWEQSVVPDKEYLQQTHFVCVIPPYRRPDITEPVSVRLCVVSSGKTSESHQFVYTPVNGAIPSVHVDSALSPPQHHHNHHHQQQPQQAQFFNKLLWPSNVSKHEQDMGIMPPPESSMVPMATRRSSLSVPSTSDLHSPPLRTLKQEYIDENSQSSVVDAMDVHQEQQQRYRHVSESSLDVNHGDSNLSMINDNSMEMINNNNNNNPNSMITNENSNENSVDVVMVRRNSMSNSLNVNLNNPQQISTIANGGNPLNTTTMHCSNSVVTDRLTLSQSTMMQNILAASSTTSSSSASSVSSVTSSSSSSAPTAEDLRVIDLRMKMPMATVADLVNSSAPSMATLQSFGVTEASNHPLPTQSAQSIENFLTNIETKPTSIMTTTELQLKNDVSAKINEIINNQTNLLTTTSNSLVVDHTEPVYLSSQRPFLSSTTTQNEVMQIVAKSEAAAIAEQTTATTIAHTTAINNNNNNNNIPSSLVANHINTVKLDDLVNSTVESHICSPTRSDQTKDTTLSMQSQTDVLITSRDVMLNSRPSLMVPPMINTTLPSPIMTQSDLNHSHSSPNLSPEIILNSQISPSLMCRNQDNSTLMPSTICQTNPTVDTNLLPVNQQTVPTLSPNNNLSTLHSPLSMNNHPLGIVTTEPENAVLLEAAVDLLKTQKKLSELDHSLSSQLQGNNFVQTQQFTVTAPVTTTQSLTTTTTVVQTPTENNAALQQDNKSDFVIPVPVKEMAGVNAVTSAAAAAAAAAAAVQDKKNEDRMIPQSFTSLTENELINLINPSCFDQGNNTNFQ